MSVTKSSMLGSVRPAIEAARAANRSLAILLPFSFWAGEK
jgi:hypothetical protein